MTSARRPARRKAKPAVESTVYDGSQFCGTIVPKGGTFVARLTSGKSLGKFANERLAQRALTAARRTPQPQHGIAIDEFAWRPGEIVVGQVKGDARPNKRAQASAHSTASGASQT
jgi:hypothetical protein